MSTTFIIANTNHYPYHKYILSILANNLFRDEPDVSIIDICKCEPSTLGQHLSSASPQLIITLDLAGFEMRTFTGECFFNILPCKVCNIIWGNKPEYDKYLRGKLSLSMLFYDATGINHYLTSIYPYLRYYYPTLHSISYSKSHISETESIKALNALWTHFTNEVLL